MRFAAEMLRHKALGSAWHAPAFEEEVGMWRSHDKKQANSAHNKGAIGRLIAIDPWGNGTCILIAKGTDIQDPELVSGLQPKIVAVVYVYPSGYARRMEQGCHNNVGASLENHSKPLKENTYGFAWILDIHNTLHRSLRRLRVLQ